jgi:hypothetical protein
MISSTLELKLHLQVVKEKLLKSTYDRVSLWNQTSGKTPPAVGTNAYYEALYNQCKLIQEELNEFIEGIQNRDLPNMAKEGADLDVVVAGLNYLASHDYTSVITAVLDNNDLKHTTDIDAAYDCAQVFIDKGMDCEVFTGDAETYTVKRCSDDKVMKLPNHPATNLEGFIAEPILERTLVVRDLVANSDVIDKVTETFPEAQVVPLEDLDESAQIIIDMFNGRDYVILEASNGELIQILTLDDKEDTING